MQKKYYGLIVLFAIMLMVAVGCSEGSSGNSQGSGENDNGSSEGENKESVVLKLGHGTSKDSLYHAGSKKFKELVEEKTNGQVEVQLFSDGQLGHDKDLIQGMKMGSIQMGMIGVEPLTNVAPKLKAIGLPYLFNDRETAYKVLDGELGKEMVENLPEDQGVRVLGYFENGFRNVTNSKREITNPEDLEGLKLRTPNSEVSLAIFEALGANPTPMAFGELYTALEQGTVDGQENPLALIYSSKFYEVQNYISLTEHMYSPMVLTISEKTWSELSSENQKIIQEAANQAKKYERKLSAEQEQELITKLKEEGVTINEPEKKPFIEATKSVHEKFAEDIGKDFYERLIEATK